MTPPLAVPAARQFVTDPIVPVLIGVATALAAGMLSWETLGWVGLGGAAGYALSGSV